MTIDLSAVMTFLDALDSHKLSYRVTRVRADGLMVELSLPGEHWEVEFMLSGHIEVERLRSDGAIQEIQAVGQLVELLGAWD
jgi:hypothetical protein